MQTAPSTQAVKSGDSVIEADEALAREVFEPIGFFPIGFAVFALRVGFVNNLLPASDDQLDARLTAAITASGLNHCQTSSER